jgi:hypothetical protein
MSYRVQIPKEQWTPFRNEVFAKELGNLEEKRAAALYLFLYDRAYNRPSNAVAVTVRQLSSLLNMDERVIKKCLAELRRKELIRKIRSGVRRSRINKDVWKVPLAEVDLKKDSWTPIPRVLTPRYNYQPTVRIFASCAGLDLCRFSCSASRELRSPTT